MSSNNLEYILRYVMNSGHKGLIRAIDIDPSESPKYYVTGSDDATLRIWSTKKINDPSSNSKHYQTLLKGGHQMPVTDVLINHVHPNEVFSASDDKLALKWDLNTRTVTNQFFGHFAGVTSIDLHKTIPDLLFTGSKDKTSRMWDSRTKNKSIMTFAGHTDAVNKVICFNTDPQLITCSNDKTIRFYDIRYNTKCTKIINYHTTPVRTMCRGSFLEGNAFVSGSASEIYSWAQKDAAPLTEFNVNKLDVVNTMEVIKNGKILQVGTNQGLQAYDYFTGEPIDCRFSGDDNNQSVSASAYSQNLRYDSLPKSSVMISASQKLIKIYTI
jgi:pleiotropic regulator 1